MKPDDRKPNIVELDKLAREGQLWSIEVVYELDKEACSMRYYNQTNPEVMRIREAIFRAGFIIPLKDKDGQPLTGSYQVIPPMDILKVYLHRQTEYFRGV
jgi:hypothetical protein